MIIKSLTAAVVSMATAAGVVYFGTAPSDDAHPHKTEPKVETPKVGTEERAGAKSSATSRIVVTGEAQRDTRRARWEGKPQRDTDAPNWRDKYMQSSDDDAKDPELTPLRELQIKPDSIRERDDNPKHMHEAERMLMEAIARKSGESSLKIDPDGTVTEDVMDVDRENGVTIIRRRIMRSDASGEHGEKEMEVEVDVQDSTDVNIADLIADIEARAGDIGDERVMVIRKETTTKTDDLGLSGMDDKGFMVFEKADPKELLSVVDTIKDADLRDQALYSIATYALRFDDFKSADKALGKIEQSDLSHTVRSRIAFRHAEVGDIDKALAEIDEIEDSEFRDIVRVQMIETLTTPLEKRIEAR